MTAITERPPAAATVEVPPGDALVGSGLLVVSATMVAIQVVAGAVIPPVAVPAVLYAVLGLAVMRRRSRRLLVTAAILPPLHMLASAPFLAEALTHPETPGSFLPEALGLITAIAVALAAVTALRGTHARSRRLVVMSAAGMAVVAVAASIVAAAGVEAAARQPGDVAVPAQATTYPERVEISAGGARVWVDNRDAVRHTFVVEGTDVHAELPGSSSVAVDVDLDPGSYRFFCDVPGHESMTGELIAR